MGQICSKGNDDGAKFRWKASFDGPHLAPQDLGRHSDLVSDDKSPELQHRRLSRNMEHRDEQVSRDLRPQETAVRKPSRGGSGLYGSNQSFLFSSLFDSSRSFPIIEPSKSVSYNRTSHSAPP